METIRTYLDNVFGGLPQTEEVKRIKAELLDDMEAKYLDLRENGQNEHEAIATVISDFGNIDELLEELDIPIGKNDKRYPTLSTDNARDFLAVSSKTSSMVGIGVAIILAGVSLLVALSSYIEAGRFLSSSSLMSGDNASIFPVLLLLIAVIPAVALFIYSGSLAEKYKFIEKGEFELPVQTKSVLAHEYDTRKPKFTVAIITGVCLCLFAVIVLLSVAFFRVSAAPAGVSIFMLIIAIAVFVFIHYGSMQGAYQKLLKTGDYSVERQKSNKVVGAVASIVWPLATAVFLTWGFLFDGWGIAWVIYPITGVLFGGFAAFYSALHEDQ